MQKKFPMHFIKEAEGRKAVIILPLTYVFHQESLGFTRIIALVPRVNNIHSYLFVLKECGYTYPLGKIKEHCFDTAGTNLPVANLRQRKEPTLTYIIYNETNAYANHVI